MSNKYIKIPTIRRMGSTALGTLIACAGAYHLMMGDPEGHDMHDIAVVAGMILGAGMVFPESVIPLIQAWRGTKPAE